MDDVGTTRHAVCKIEQPHRRGCGQEDSPHPRPVAPLSLLKVPASRQQRGQRVQPAASAHRADDARRQQASITTGFKNCLSLHESRCAPAARVDSLANSALRIVEEAQFRAGVNNREEW
jgi:hypothetical protein